MVVLTWEPERTNEVVKRRTERKHPEGLKVIGEWIDLAGGRVFCLIEAQDPKIILEATFAWTDLGKFECTPVMDVEDVLKLLPKP
jgi:hypothetical protein